MYEKGKQVLDYELNSLTFFGFYCWKLVLWPYSKSKLELNSKKV